MLFCLGLLSTRGVHSAHAGFADHGIPVKVSYTFGRAAGLDAQGTKHFYQGRGQAPSPFFILDTCLDTGRTFQINCTVEEAHYPRAMLVADNGKLYIGTSSKGHFFEYDPLDQDLSYLGIPAGQTYHWQLARGADGKIYGGTYPDCKLIRLDPSTGLTEDLGRLDPTEMYSRELAASSDGYIYVGIGTAKCGIAAYHIESGTWSQLLPEDERKPGTPQVYKAANGECYARSDLGDFHLSKGKAVPVDAQAIPGKANPAFPDGTQITSTNYWTGSFNVKSPTGAQRKYNVAMENAGTRLFVLTKGPDDKVYGSSFLPLQMFVYDPTVDDSTNMGRPTVATGEIYSFLNYRDELVMAAYPGCSLARYDPRKEWKIGEKGQGNPRRSRGGLSKYVYRPYVMCPAPDGEKILIGGIADYGILGGAISIFNPETMEIEEEYRNVIPNQSVTALCLTDQGLVAGGSCTQGGTGSHSKEKEGHFFLWDYQKREVVHDLVPAPNEGIIRALVKGPDGLIYGFTYRGHLFVVDPETGELKHSRPLGQGYAVFNPMAVSENGRIILLTKTKILEVIPGEFDFRVLAEYSKGIDGGIAIVDSRVYFCSGDHLLSHPLP